MYKRFYPHMTAENVFSLDADFCKSKGIKGMIFDIDNTLVTHDTVIPPEDIINYFNSLEDKGIKIAIVSNNNKERVETFSRDLGYPYIGKAWKPFKKNLKAVQNEFGLKSDEICLVGDQIFTDIYGGLRMGFYTVLVTAVGENETGFVAFKRIFENAVMKEYRKLYPEK